MKNKKKIYKGSDSHLFIRAVAEHEHQEQKYGSKPYIYHLDNVFNEAIEFQDCLNGYYAQKHRLSDNYQQEITYLCYTHDIIEDCEISEWDLANITSVDNASRTKILSTNKSKHVDDYYSQISKDLVNTFVKLCDRLANVRFSVKNPSEKSTKVLIKYKNHQPLIKEYFIQHIELVPMINKIDELIKSVIK